MTEIYEQNLAMLTKISNAYTAQSQALFAQGLEQMQQTMQVYNKLANAQTEALMAGVRIAEAQINSWAELIGAPTSNAA